MSPRHFNSEFCAITSSTFSGRSMRFHSYRDFLAHPEFDHVVTLKIEKMKIVSGDPDYVGAIERLPERLETLQVNDCNGLTKFPTCLPMTIHSVFLVNTRVGDIPNLSHLENLETLNMYGSNVSVVRNPLPRSLRTLDLTHNRLVSVDYSCIPATIARVSLGHNSLTELPPERLNGIAEVHNNSVMIQRRFVEHVMETAKPIYQQAQNVHDSTIQQSVRDAISKLLKMSEVLRNDEEVTLSEIKRVLSSSIYEIEIYKFVDKFDFLDSYEFLSTTIIGTHETLWTLLIAAFRVAKNHILVQVRFGTRTLSRYFKVEKPTYYM